jgi:hypothetical protein
MSWTTVSVAQLDVPPVQLPDWHASPLVQLSPSLHDDPSASVGFEQAPVDVLHVPTVWHWSEATQVTGLPPVQAPVWQVSVCVHALLSLHAVPSLLTGFEQAPVDVLHVPALWHWSCATQVTGLPPAQLPDWQVSVCVHASPSLHAVPSLLAGFEQTPVDVLHVPVLWHWSCATHVTGLPPAQLPDWQLSVCVHALPSLHAVPFALAGFEQTPVDVLHMPAVWHWSWATHVTGLPPLQLPDWHASVCVQALPSLHALPFGLTGFEQTPVDVLHVPTAWHWSDAVQVTGVPPTHTPD